MAAFQTLLGAPTEAWGSLWQAGVAVVRGGSAPGGGGASHAPSGATARGGGGGSCGAPEPGAASGEAPLVGF